MKSGVAFGMTQSRHYCSSCGRVFVLEHCNQRVPLPHHGFEQVTEKNKKCRVFFLLRSTPHGYSGGVYAEKRVPL